MARYRSRSRVVMDILGAIQKEGPVAITRLITVANTTHARVQEQLVVFEDHGLITCDAERPLWSLTDRGQEALAELRRIDAAMRDFGIDL